MSVKSPVQPFAPPLVIPGAGDTTNRDSTTSSRASTTRDSITQPAGAAGGRSYHLEVPSPAAHSTKLFGTLSAVDTPGSTTGSHSLSARSIKTAATPGSTGSSLVSTPGSTRSNSSLSASGIAMRGLSPTAHAITPGSTRSMGSIGHNPPKQAFGSPELPRRTGLATTPLAHQIIPTPPGLVLDNEAAVLKSLAAAAKPAQLVVGGSPETAHRSETDSPAGGAANAGDLSVADVTECSALPPAGIATADTPAEQSQHRPALAREDSYSTEGSPALPVREAPISAATGLAAEPPVLPAAAAAAASNTVPVPGLQITEAALEAASDEVSGQRSGSSRVAEQDEARGHSGSGSPSASPKNGDSQAAAAGKRELSRHEPRRVFGLRVVKEDEELTPTPAQKSAQKSASRNGGVDGGRTEADGCCGGCVIS